MFEGKYLRPFPPFPHHFNYQLMMNSDNLVNTEKNDKEMSQRKQIVGERWKRLVGEFIFGGEILFDKITKNH